MASSADDNNNNNNSNNSTIAAHEPTVQLRPRVGGPWSDFLSMTKESITKLLRQGVPKTRSTRLSWLAGHHEVDTTARVSRLQLVDLFALSLALLLSPLTLAVYPLLVVLSLPGLVTLRLYLACLRRPRNDLRQDTAGFFALALALWLLGLPFFTVVAAYGLAVFPTVLVWSALYAAVSLRLVHWNQNMALLRGCNGWPKCAWRDCVSAVAGAMDRQGFWKLALKLPSAFVVVPVLKYLFGANPLLYKLSIRFRNTWTSPLEVQDDKAVAAVVQAVSWPMITTNLMEPDAEQQPQRQSRCQHHPAAFKTDRIVSGHIPFPAEDRGARAVMAVLTSNGVVTFASAEHNVNGSIFHSMTAKRSIYNLQLHMWNPCHYLTGYVEVNLQHDGGIEQPMWCVVGDNYIGNWLFERADALLWHFDPDARSRVSLASTLSFDGSVGRAANVDDLNGAHDDSTDAMSQSIAVLESASELGTGRSIAFMTRDTITSSTESFVI